MDAHARSATHACVRRTFTGSLIGSSAQITHTSWAPSPAPSRAAVASLAIVARFALAATAATHARLWCFQCIFWQLCEQYHILRKRI